MRIFSLLFGIAYLAIFASASIHCRLLEKDRIPITLTMTVLVRLSFYCGLLCLCVWKMLGEEDDDA